MNYFLSSINYSVPQNRPWVYQKLLTAVNYSENSISFGKRNAYLIEFMRDANRQIKCILHKKDVQKYPHTLVESVYKIVIFVGLFFPALGIKILHRVGLRHLLLSWHQPPLKTLIEGSSPPLPLPPIDNPYKHCKSGEELLCLALQKANEDLYGKASPPHLGDTVWKLALFNLLISVNKLEKEDDCDTFSYLNWGSVKVCNAFACKITKKENPEKKLSIYSTDAFSSPDAPCYPVTLWEEISPLKNEWKNSLRYLIENNLAAEVGINESDIATFREKTSKIQKSLETLTKAVKEKYKDTFQIDTHEKKIHYKNPETFPENAFSADFKHCLTLFDVMATVYRTLLPLFKQKNSKFDPEESYEDIPRFCQLMTLQVLSQAYIPENVNGATLLLSPSISLPFENWSDKVICCHEEDLKSATRVAFHRVNDFTSRSSGEDPLVTDEPYRLACLLKEMSPEGIGKILSCLEEGHPLPSSVSSEFTSLLKTISQWVQKRFYGPLVVQNRKPELPSPQKILPSPPSPEARGQNRVSSNHEKVPNNIDGEKFEKAVHAHYTEMMNLDTGGSCTLYAILQDVDPKALEENRAEQLQKLRKKVAEHMKHPDNIKNFLALDEAIEERCETFSSNLQTYTTPIELKAISDIYERPIHIFSMDQTDYFIDEWGKPLPDILIGKEEHQNKKPFLLFKKGEHMKLLKEKPRGLVSRIGIRMLATFRKTFVG